MFFTQPKFHKLTSERDLLAKVQQFEIYTNFDSPRTQKALVKMNLAKIDFRRKNKFEIQNEIESRRIPYNEQLLKEQYMLYLEQLLNNYLELKETRKEINEWFIKKQQEEDELQGYTYIPCQTAANPVRQPQAAISIDDKIGKINQELYRQQSLTDAMSKRAILEELDRRQWEQINQERREKNIQIRATRLMERKKKASELNLKAQKTFMEQKKLEQQQVEQGLEKTKEFLDKLNQREIDIVNKKTISLQEKIQKNRQIEEKIDFRRNLLKQEQSDMEIRNVRKDTQTEENRLKSVERQAKERQERLWKYEQRLQEVNKKSSSAKVAQEMELCNSFGQKMLTIEEHLKKNEELIKKEAEKLIKERESKFKKHKSNLIKVQDQEITKQQQLIEKLQNKDEIVKRLIIIKSEEQKQLRDQNALTKKEHQQLILSKRRNQHSRQELLLEKSVFVQKKLEKQRSDQDRLFLHSIMTKQKLEQENTQRQQEISQIHYQSSQQLLDKLKDLVTEEEFLELQKQYNLDKKPQTANPQTVNKL